MARPELNVCPLGSKICPWPFQGRTHVAPCLIPLDPPLHGSNYHPNARLLMILLGRAEEHIILRRYLLARLALECLLQTTQFIKAYKPRCASFCTYLNNTELSTCKFKTIARQTYICYLPACFSACVKDQPCNIHHPVVNILFCATCLFFIYQGRHSMTAEAPYNSARIWPIDKLISGNRAIII